MEIQIASDVVMMVHIARKKGVFFIYSLVNLLLISETHRYLL